MTAQIGPPAGASPPPMPMWFAAALDAAWARGVAAARSAPPQPRSDDYSAFVEWAMPRFPAAPTAADDQRELTYLHRVARQRTPAANVFVKWLADDGDKAVWQHHLAQWQQGVGPRQAAYGAALLAQADHVNKQLNDVAKQRFGRNRPYVTDPSLPMVVQKSNRGSRSYPSGHTARAFMEATIMSHLMPHRREEFMRLARQMAMARVYGGAHYPSDTVAGAWEGGVVAAWVIRNMDPTGDYRTTVG